MKGFEPCTSGVEKNQSTKLATTTAHSVFLPIIQNLSSKNVWLG